MSNFAIVRLGKDTVPEIKTLDSHHGSPDQPIHFSIRCSQVPQEAKPGDYAFFCLGSDNNKGIATEWVRGLRALGKITKKSGGPGYNDQWQVDVEVPVILPESVTQKDLLAKAPHAYFWCSDIPVLGVDTHSNQTVQLIKEQDPNQNVGALLYGLKANASTFQNDAVKAYPELASLFAYRPPPPTTSASNGNAAGSSTAGKPNLASLVAGFTKAAKEASLRIDNETTIRFAAALLAKPFVILTGLSGSGKTKLAQAFARWITPPTLPAEADPFKPGTKLKAAQTEYTVVRSNSGIVEVAGEDGKIAALPRAIIEEWADYIEKNSITTEMSGRDLRDRVEASSRYTSYLHRMESHYKPAAFALVEARKTAPSGQCFAVVPVGADWTSNEHILGYPDNLNGGYFQQTALKLMLHADQNPGTPHFLILDEMNLSHVERYFADVLSIIESETEVALHHDQDADGKPKHRDGVPPTIRLPQNFFVIGTVNVDETTYMFSPKVLDRANVLEFRVSAEDMEDFLKQPSSPALDKFAEPGNSGASFGSQFVQAASKDYDASLDESEISKLRTELMFFFNALAAHGAEFGFRAGKEIARFLHFHKQLSGTTLDFRNAMDAQITQKLLPKLHGSRNKLTPVLWVLAALCEKDHTWKSESDPKKRAKGFEDFLAEVKSAVETGDEKYDPVRVAEKMRTDNTKAHYPLSFDKTVRMWRILEANGFVSFAEA